MHIAVCKVSDTTGVKCHGWMLPSSPPCNCLLSSLGRELQHCCIAAVLSLCLGLRVCHSAHAARLGATMLAVSQGAVGIRVDARLVQVQVGLMNRVGQVII